MALSIDVWKMGGGARPRVWTAEHGALRVPSTWEFLPNGNAFLTDAVKSLGPVWTRKRGARGDAAAETIGFYVPSENIAKAQALAAEQGKPADVPPKMKPNKEKPPPPPPPVSTPRSRKHKKIKKRIYKELVKIRKPPKPVPQKVKGVKLTHEEQLARRRESYRVKRATEEYHYFNRIRDEIVRFLNFAPEHKALASDIAWSAAKRACRVGSGKVGRNRGMTPQNKAKKAAMAYIRHRFTEYDREVSRMQNKVRGKGKKFKEAYGKLKWSAVKDVTRFIEKHRKGGGA